ncbi:hypothetical protein Cgig2_006577 [Carnegiea gigantea]|uniref:Uncharacterized protein n=1 Tax=Carnegiea gigantea TaxID=171969 RepID=A0A9Q1JMC1_9CARY|nr:hypothetical protein Cgig2_006577 [Carnegiea gigantea]
MGASNMAIDQDVSMVTNNEIFKCKQDGIRFSKDVDRKVRVIDHGQDDSTPSTIQAEVVWVYFRARKCMSPSYPAPSITSTLLYNGKEMTPYGVSVVFMNMWFTDPSCKDEVTKAWSRGSHPDAVENLLLQLENCSNELVQWNQNTFGHVDKATYAILQCPLAVHVWGGSGPDMMLWSTRYRTPADGILKAWEALDKDSFGDFLTVMWERWNAHNCFIFKRPDNNLSVLGKRAIAFIRSFHELQDVELSHQTTLHPNS